MEDIQLLPQDTREEVIKKAVAVRPTQRQIKWQELEFTAFIHFGVNTFTNKEWGDGTESPEIFNPVNFDADQMIKAIKDAQMKAVILTCKHHDGFCLWQSKYTEHSVKNSPWKNGKGDIVKEISQACKRHGIKFGVYLSPWDRHDSRYGNSPEYNEYYLNQLTELLTEYGEVFDLWLDGACGEGPNGKKQEYDWQKIFAMVRELQPEATITGVAPDARWCGNEAGICRDSEWSVVPISATEALPPEVSEKTAYAITRHNIGDKSLCCNEDLGSIDKLMEHAQNMDRLYWYPAQVNLSIRPGWFYHDYEDAAVRPLYKLVNIYLNSVGGNSQLLLNLPPDKNGRFHPNDVKRLKELGDFIKTTFKTNLARAASWTNDFECVLKSDLNVNLLMLCEDISQGQRVESFEVYAKTQKGFELVYSGTTIGYKKLIRLTEQVYSDMKVVITKSRDIPCMKLPELFLMPQIERVEEQVRDNSIIAQTDFEIKGFTAEEIEEYNLNFIFTSDENRYSKMPRTDKLPTLEFDMKREYSIKGINYMPVATGFDANLNICGYSLYTSVDGVDFATVAQNCELSNIYHNPILHKLYFDKPVTARYIRFEVLNTLNEEKLVVGEIGMVEG